MKLFKYLFSRKSASPKGTVISYGRGPEGEEVIIDITETKHINLKVIITFFVCLPVMMALFSPELRKQNWTIPSTCPG